MHTRIVHLGAMIRRTSTLVAIRRIVHLGAMIRRTSTLVGVLEIIKKIWRNVTIINVVIFALINAVYSIRCCAFPNARRAGYFK